jgi:glycosyltransferase involved in cell wall biosynthesis
MSAATTSVDLSFPVAGAGGGEGELRRQAEALGASGRFSFHGFQENIRTVLEGLDIFGYPLCRDTYANSEKSLQETMAVGIPPVVFPHGGVLGLVEDGITGRVVHSPEQYTSALVQLARDPAERQRLGAAARRFVRRAFDPRRLLPARPGGGGIIQFRNAYPHDPWLRYWTSLVLAAAGRPEAAARERAEALRLGWPACQVPRSAEEPLPGVGDG